MKLLLTLLITLFSFITAFSQDKILDFYGKDLTYCTRYLTNVKDFDNTSSTYLFKKEFDGLEVFFLYSSKYKRITNIIIPYSNKETYELLVKFFDKINKKKYNGAWLIRTDKDDYLVQCVVDKKRKIFVIQ